MIARFVIAALLASASSAAFATEPSFQFSGDVVVNDQMPMAYGLALPAKHEQIVDLPSGLKLEVVSAREDGANAETQTRLLKPAANGQFVVLHQARTTGPSNFDRSITYRVCGEQVTFITPAPLVSPRCVGSE